MNFFFFFYCRVLVVADITDVVYYSCFLLASFNIWTYAELFCGGGFFFLHPKVWLHPWKPFSFFFFPTLLLCAAVTQFNCILVSPSIGDYFLELFPHPQKGVAFWCNGAIQSQGLLVTPLMSVYWERRDC